jgi:hypothetical protein
MVDGTVPFDSPDAVLLGTPGETVCLFATFVDDSCVMPPPLCFPTETTSRVASREITPTTTGGGGGGGGSAGGGGGSSGGGGGGSGGGGDKVTSFSSLKVASSQKAANLFVTASMPESGTIAVGGTVSVPNASKVFKLKTVSVKTLPGATMKIRVKLSSKALKAAKKALGRHRKVRANLSITARDAAGNTKTEKRSVKLKR